MKKVFLVSACILMGLFSFGQASHDPHRVPGELLVQFAVRGAAADLEKDLQVINGRSTSLRQVGELSDVMGIWHFSFDESAVSPNEMLMAVKMHRSVQEAQFNHYVKLRSVVPNDPGYAQQWQYDNDGSNGGVPDADIDAPEAWGITTGGITSQGDSIVVAIIDDGVNLNHPDLGSNLWKNYAEIPGNGVDDDGNGYVDDFDGWNAFNNNGTITGGSHGTPVAGIVGAKGNNGVGVAGVNWDVKLMIIRGSSGTEATVVAAYAYALKMRKLYNQSNGTQGAFVVATNSSFGVDNANPANYPLWCAMYDSMGVAGIISAGATANANTNVDVAGDMPTACASDYLISVTNVGRNDVKITSAGYGVNTIDIGAFGQDTWTLTQNGYGAFGGTSGATPHVAGTAALMYSVPCPDFIQLAKANPPAAALQIKEWILNSGDPNASLASITVSGRRLNTFNAVSEVLNNCGPCPLPGGVSAQQITVSGAAINWFVSPNATEYILEFREQGSPSWNTVITGPSPAVLSGLNPCTWYQYRLKTVCGPDSATGYTNIFTFKTDGCCEPPSASSVGGLTTSEAVVTWQNVTAAVAYDFRYRLQGAGTWNTLTGISGNQTPLTGLQICTRYEYQVATVCTSGVTDFSQTFTFKTKGCGACEEENYCNITASSDFVFINRVQLGVINNTSGNNGGYASFIEDDYAVLMADSASSITLTPTFPVFPVGANWRVWVDWNGNGIFENSELAFSGNGSAAITGNIVPPVSADTGITRMRVAAAALQQPVECGDGGLGEVEDYCVRIKPRSFAGFDNQAEASLVLVYPNPTEGAVTVSFPQKGVNGIYLTDMTGKAIVSISLTGAEEQVQWDVRGLASGIYLIHFQVSDNSLKPVKLIIK